MTAAPPRDDWDAWIENIDRAEVLHKLALRLTNLASHMATRPLYDPRTYQRLEPVQMHSLVREVLRGGITGSTSELRRAIHDMQQACTDVLHELDDFNHGPQPGLPRNGTTDA